MNHLKQVLKKLRHRLKDPLTSQKLQAKYLVKRRASILRHSVVIAIVLFLLVFQNIIAIMSPSLSAGYYTDDESTPKNSIINIVIGIVSIIIYLGFCILAYYKIKLLPYCYLVFLITEPFTMGVLSAIKIDIVARNLIFYFLLQYYALIKTGEDCTRSMAGNCIN